MSGYPQRAVEPCADNIKGTYIVLFGILTLITASLCIYIKMMVYHAKSNETKVLQSWTGGLIVLVYALHTVNVINTVFSDESFAENCPIIEINLFKYGVINLFCWGCMIA